LKNNKYHNPTHYEAVAVQSLKPLLNLRHSHPFFNFGITEDTGATIKKDDF